MLGNLQHLSKEYKKFYLLYLFLLLVSIFILMFTKPAFSISLLVLTLFFLVDLFLLGKSERKVTKVILGDLFVYLVWLLVLYIL